MSPSSTYRVLKGAGLLDSWKPKRSLKGTGFVQPLAPHQHWRVDVSCINISGSSFYLCSLLDGCSRSIVHGELREVTEGQRRDHPPARPGKIFPLQTLKIPLFERVTLPAKGRYPDACFDGILVRGVRSLSCKPIRIQGVSDHLPAVFSIVID